MLYAATRRGSDSEGMLRIAVATAGPGHCGNNRALGASTKSQGAYRSSASEGMYRSSYRTDLAIERL